jgi:hypothetical protein
MKLVAATLVQMRCSRPVNGRPMKVCLDLGYDYDEVRSIVQLAGFEPVVRGRRDEQESKRARNSVAYARAAGSSSARTVG